MPNPHFIAAAFDYPSEAPTVAGDEPYQILGTSIIGPGADRTDMVTELCYRARTYDLNVDYANVGSATRTIGDQEENWEWTAAADTSVPCTAVKHDQDLPSDENDFITQADRGSLADTLHRGWLAGLVLTSGAPQDIIGSIDWHYTVTDAILGITTDTSYTDNVVIRISKFYWAKYVESGSVAGYPPLIHNLLIYPAINLSFQIISAVDEGIIPSPWLDGQGSTGISHTGGTTEIDFPFTLQRGILPHFARYSQLALASGVSGSGGVTVALDLQSLTHFAYTP